MYPIAIGYICHLPSAITNCVSTDHFGSILTLTNASGALIGGYQGYEIGAAAGATGEDMAGYVLGGGAAVGGLSASFGYAVATSGMPFANTAAIMAGSFSNFQQLTRTLMTFHPQQPAKNKRERKK